MKPNKFVAMVILLVLSCPSELFAFDDKRTHPDFTEGATKKSVIDRYLKDILGFPKGYDSTLPYYNDKVVMDGVSADQIANWNKNGWPILELLKAGSASEDTPDCRAA